jgi:hypothetical protein
MFCRRKKECYIRERKNAMSEEERVSFRRRKNAASEEEGM